MYFPKSSLFVVFGVALTTTAIVASLIASPSRAQPSATTLNQATVWEYGRLKIDGDQVTWQAGETNNFIRTFSLADQYRQLKGNSQPTLTNLLNVIGRDGWELVATDEVNWTFKRHQ